MSDQPLRVGFVGGYDLAQNVRTLLKNLYRVLEPRPTEFQFDLLVGEEIDAPEGFNPIALESVSLDSARQRIRLLERAIRQYSTRDDPEVVMQVTKFPTHGTAAAVAGWRTGTATITRLAGDNFREHRFAQGLGERLRMYGLKNVIALAAVHLPDAVIALGPSGRQDLSDRLRRKNVYTIPQPVNREQFSPIPQEEQNRLRGELGMSDDERVILTVGRISRRKGARTVLKTAPELPNDVVWYLVGDGPMRATLADKDGVRAVGSVPHDQVSSYYRAADLYVHPSLHDGLPNVLIEATACGTPSVARDVGECRTVATGTFEDDAELPPLLQREYSSVELDAQFEEDSLAEQYKRLLCEVGQ